jgi:hypothetical protein
MPCRAAQVTASAGADGRSGGGPAAGLVVGPSAAARAAGGPAAPLPPLHAPAILGRCVGEAAGRLLGVASREVDGGRRRGRARADIGRERRGAGSLGRSGRPRCLPSPSPLHFFSLFRGGGRPSFPQEEEAGTQPALLLFPFLHRSFLASAAYPPGRGARRAVPVWAERREREPRAASPQCRRTKKKKEFRARQYTSSHTHPAPLSPQDRRTRRPRTRLGGEPTPPSPPRRRGRGEQRALGSRAPSRLGPAQ